jgi:hypothetical protein
MDIGLFLWAVLAHWQSYVTGGLVTAGIGIYERKTGRNIPWKIYASVFLLSAGFVAMFYAWHDEHHNAQVLIGQKADLWGNLNSSQENLKLEQVKSEFLESQNKQLQRRIDEDITTIGRSQIAIGNLGTQLGKLTVLDPPRVTIKSIALPRIGTAKRTLWLVIALTSKPRMPVKGIITCERELGMDAWGGMAQSSDDGGVSEEMIRPINSRQIEVHIYVPPWKPENPVVITGWAPFDLGPGKCTFEETP